MAIGNALMRLSAACLVLAGLSAVPIQAQRLPPEERGLYAAPRPGGPGPVGGVPGRFDYYTLVLSWSPTHCASLTRTGFDPQCHARDGRRYAFVLHGLWPQYERGFPQFCPTGSSTYVPPSVIDRMQDIMPSPKLAIHEYRKHGTCSGLDPAGYYDLSRRLFARIKIPSRYVAPQADQMVGTAELLQEFLAANPGLIPEMVVVACGGPGNRLKEVRFCFTRDGEPRRCGANESQTRLCPAARMHVPPVRVGAGPPGRTGGARGGPPPPLPAPVLPPPGLRSL